MKPAVSVVMTSYNIEDYVERCILSIRDQTFKDFELIVVDDGSSDLSVARIERAARFGFRRKKIIPMPCNTPGGVATAANVGVSAASGEFIAYADGDDWFEPDMLESMVGRARESDADIVIAAYRNFDEAKQTVEIVHDETLIGRFAAAEREAPRVQDIEFKHEVLRLNAVPWRKLYRTDFLRAHRIEFPEGDYFFEDNPYHWMNVIEAGKIAFVDKVICHHRINRPGQTMDSTGLELLALFEHFDTIEGFLSHKGLGERYGAALLGWIFGQAEWISKKIHHKHWGALYDRVSKIAADRPLDEVVDGLMARNLGRYGWAVAMTAAARDRERFFENLRFFPTHMAADTFNKVAALDRKVEALTGQLQKAQETIASILAGQEEDRRTENRELILRMMQDEMTRRARSPAQ